MNKITLYSKPDCPLCDKAEQLLNKLQSKFHYEIEVVDITQDEVLFQLYCFDIPVIMLNGVERFRGHWCTEELQAALQHKSGYQDV